MAVAFRSCGSVLMLFLLKKKPLSAFPDGYRPISNTSVLSKVFEKLIGARLSRYMKLNGFLPGSQYAYCKGRGTCAAFLEICCCCQSGLDCGH